MDKTEIDRERRTQRRLERLGTDKPVCVECGEDDDRCLEQHHIAGRKYDDAEAIVCRNCHRKLSDDQLDHPRAMSATPGRLECIGHFLLGLADLFARLVEKLRQFGRNLIDLAAEQIDGSNGSFA